MNTTSLFVDLLISGVQVAIWMCLFIASFVGVDVAFLKELKGWELTLAAILLPIVYPVGIFVDNFADESLKPVGRWLKRRSGLKDGPIVSRLLGEKGDDWLARQLDYTRMRIRISRSSLLNFALITFCGELFLWKQWQPAFGVSWATLALLAGGIGTLATVLAGYSWYRITVLFSKKLADGLSELPEPTAGNRGRAREVAAELIS